VDAFVAVDEFGDVEIAATHRKPVGVRRGNRWIFRGQRDNRSSRGPASVAQAIQVIV